MRHRFWQLARPYRRRLALGLVLLAGTNALGLSIPWLLRGAIHALERREAFREVVWRAAAIALFALAQAGVRTGSRLAILGASRDVARDLRERFYQRLLRLDASWFDANRTGDVMSRGVNDIQLVQSFFGPGILNLLNTAIVYVATIALMLRLDARLTLVALIPFPLLLLLVNRLSRRVFAASREVQEQLASISNRAQENISGIQQVKVYAQEAREIEGFRELSTEFRRRNLRMASLRGAMVALIGIVTGAGTLVVIWVGGAGVIAGRLGFGDFVAFNAYLGMLAWPTVALGWIINTFQRGVGAMARLDEVLSAEPSIPSAMDERAEEAGPVDGAIEIRNLTFGYEEGREEGARRELPALHDVTLTIPPGSRVALVGPVGSGKSTLAALLARVYPVPRGAIRIGGRDLNDIPVSVLRRSLGYVPQEAFLFSRSLRENVAFGAPDAEQARIDRALELAHLRGDLALFPEGLDTVVGERGFTLSGGQRQRATLARAVVGDPRILILDDSLSSVDADTERAILARLGERLHGRTAILVSHRLSTLSAVDRIVVLDQGRVVEDGTHAELLARDGFYARLFRRRRLEESLEAS